MKKLLGISHILIISSKSAHRSGLRKTFVDNGAQNNKIEAVADFAQASVRLSNEPPVNIIICDDDIEGNPLELIHLHEKNNPESVKRLFILLASGLSDSSKSEFEIKGGNLIVEKPYTTASFMAPFEKLLTEREKISIDEKAKMGVEDALKTNDKDKALQVFGTFKNPETQPWYYSKGMIDHYDNDFINAFNNFIMSLDKKMDIKGLVNVVSTGVKSKKYQELDQFVEKWIKNFPLYTESVPDITRVVLYNKKFHLLNEMNITEQDARIPMAAGMVVASSYYLDKGNVPLVVEYAKKGIELSGLKKSIVLKCMQNMVDAGALEDAQKIYESSKLKNHFQEDTAFLETLQKLLQIKILMV